MWLGLVVVKVLVVLMVMMDPRSDWIRGDGSPILELQIGIPKVPLSLNTKWYPDFARLGTGGDSIRTILGFLGNNLQQPDQPESRFIFPVLLCSSTYFGMMLSEYPI